MTPNYSDMHPALLERYDAFKAIADQIEHIPFTINCIKRTMPEQLALHAQGRRSLQEVNQLRQSAKMPPISERENMTKVTWTMKSKHFPDAVGRCRAFDVVVLKNGRTPDWSRKWDSDKDGVEDYEELARIAEQVGLVSGGHAFGDWPHFQLPDDVA